MNPSIHMPHVCFVFFECVLPTIMWFIFTLSNLFQRLGWTLWYRCGDGYLRSTSWFYGLRRCCSLVEGMVGSEVGKGVGDLLDGFQSLCHGGICGVLEMMISIGLLDSWLLGGSFDCYFTGMLVSDIVWGLTKLRTHRSKLSLESDPLFWLYNKSVWHFSSGYQETIPTNANLAPI